jgi:hypothetical protein
VLHGKERKQSEVDKKCALPWIGGDRIH